MSPSRGDPPRNVIAEMLAGVPHCNAQLLELWTKSLITTALGLNCTSSRRARRDVFLLLRGFCMSSIATSFSCRLSVVPCRKGRRLRNVAPDELFAAQRGLAGPLIGTNLRHAQHWLFCTPFECLDEFGKQGSVRRHIPAIVFHTSVSLHKPLFSLQMQ